MKAIEINKKGKASRSNTYLGESKPFIGPLIIQKKLSIGSANDVYEQEADNMADKVVSMPEPPQTKPQPKPQTGPLLQRKCAGCEEEEQIQTKPLSDSIAPLIQRKGDVSHGASVASDAVTTQISQSKGGGGKMDNETQHFMESRFGTDFSGVKIHTSNNAIQLSRQLNAQAFTVGNDIYFNEGKYNPSSNSGKHLLAHELTHTVQQGRENIRRSIVSPHLNGINQQDEENKGEQVGGHIQLMRQRNQSGGSDHISGGVAPWRSQGRLIPSGDKHKAYTDNGSSVNAWTAIEYKSDAERYWCHGHTLGTYSKWFYSVYSRGALQTVIAKEYTNVSQQSVRSGDIAVWTPSYDHSCKVEKAVHKSSGSIDESATQVSTKNGLNALQTTSLSNTKNVYASLAGPTFFRKR